MNWDNWETIVYIAGIVLYSSLGFFIGYTITKKYKPVLKMKDNLSVTLVNATEIL